jgi:hypothetical protein
MKKRATVVFTYEDNASVEGDQSFMSDRDNLGWLLGTDGRKIRLESVRVEAVKSSAELAAEKIFLQLKGAYWYSSIDDNDKLVAINAIQKAIDEGKG